MTPLKTIIIIIIIIITIINLAVEVKMEQVVILIMEWGQGVETRIEDAISVEILIIGLMTVLITMVLELVRAGVLAVAAKHTLFRTVLIKRSSPN